MNSPVLALTEAQYLSVTELNRLLNACLEMEFPLVRVEGEISSVSRPASGHLYLSLKDESAQIKGVMWRGPATGLGFKIEPGIKVQCEGRPSVYQARGDLQIVISKMVPAGEGLLQKKFLELKAKLEREGLFDPTRKRKLPFLPKAIGVVTSSTGAVIRDIMVKLQERMPQIPVYLFPVRVQGEGSAVEIAEAVKLLGESGLVDVMIIGRGGGSLEDLWAFNEEVVVRAIFAARVPVISGVGHETDITLADYVADVRAPTPTAAAEMSVPKASELFARISELQTRIAQYDRWLQPLVQRVDELELRLLSQLASGVERQRLRLATLESRVGAIEPTKLIGIIRGKLALLESRLTRAVSKERIEALGSAVQRLSDRLQFRFSELLNSKIKRIEFLGGKLEAIGPRQVLARGYSMVATQGKAVRSSKELSVGQSLEITFFEGEALTTVTKVIP